MTVDVDTAMSACAQIFSPLRGALKTRRCVKGGEGEKYARIRGAVSLHFLHRIGIIGVRIRRE